MITITDRSRHQLNSQLYKMCYQELSAPWRGQAEAMRELGVMELVTGSSFKISVLDAMQWFAVRMAGYECQRQMPQKSLGNLMSWRDDVKWAMRAHNMKYVKGIEEWQRKKMLEVLQRAVDKGGTPKQISDAFLSEGLQISRVRADRIAVTEGTRGAAMGVMLAANDFPYECQKAWVSSGDNRVRRSPFSHNIPEQSMRELYEPWFNGEEIQFPGDPRCSASNVVHCRCTLALVAKRDAEGNLIPKRVQATNRQLLSGIMSGLAGAALAFLLEEIFSDD